MGHTPVEHAIRGKLSGSLDHKTILASTNLSPEGKRYALVILKNIRLLPDEVTVARDKLIDDLLEREQQGQSIEAIKADMGTPRVARKAIIRYRYQLRPTWWQILRKTMAITSSTMLILLVLLLLSGVWFASFDRVKPMVDYLAKINAKAAAVPEAQRAWPIYRDAILATGFRDSDVKKLARNSESWEHHDTKDKAAAVAVVEAYSKLTDKIRQGAALPGLGLVMPPRAKYNGLDALVMEQLVNTSGTQSDSVAKRSDALIILELESPAHMFVISDLAALIRDDMFVAADKQQMDMVVADLRTLMGLEKQLREHPVFMCQLASISIASRGIIATSHIMATHAGQFTDAQLVELRKLLAMYDPLAAFETKGNRYVLLDTLQRTYAPNGRVAGDALFMKLHGQETSDSNPIAAFFINVMMLPPMNLFLPSRQQVKTRIEQLQDDTFAYRRLPVWEQLRTSSPYEINDTKLNGRSFSLRGLFTYEWLLVSREAVLGSPNNLLPARDAVDVAIALEQFRRLHDVYPVTLDKLVPDFLDAMPVDYSTGLPLLYKLVDGKPLLYGRGLDNDDDGGVLDTSVKNSNNVPEKGDWILYPRPADE